MIDHYMPKASEPRAWKPGGPLPPWSAQNPRQKNAMRDWMFYQIEEAYREHREKLLLEPTNLRVLIEDEAIAEADRGDMTKLHQLFHPKFYRFLQLPRKSGRRPYARQPDHGSGEHYDETARVLMARNLVPLIRKIWRAHYGKARRCPEDGFDAHEIAAAYFGIEDVDAVAKKPSGKRKKKSRDK
jgi:hypothetical protein